MLSTLASKPRMKLAKRLCKLSCLGNTREEFGFSEAFECLRIAIKCH